VAGNQYSINISGANFGKSPQVSETGPAGVTFNLTVSGVTNRITGTVTVAAGASTGPIIITLTSEGASGNGFIGPETPTVTATGAVQGRPAGAPFFVLRPSYASALGNAGDTVGNCSTDASLTSVTATVVVGQQINLTDCAPANSGIAVEISSWTQNPLLPSNAVGGFSVSMSNDGLNNFTETITNVPTTPIATLSDQSSDFPTFYFLTPGTYTFQYQYTLANGSTSPIGNATFVVKGPTPATDGNYMSAQMLGLRYGLQGLAIRGTA